MIVFLVFGLMISASTFSQTHWKLRNHIEKRSVNYFIDHAHPVTGQVRDKANNFNSIVTQESRMSSIAATGFGLAVISHASTRGWVTQEYARAYVRKTLRFVLDHVPHHRGFFVHFLDWETGASWGKSEFSTIDTALFVAGALSAAQILNDQTIHDLTHEIYRRMDFETFLTDGGKNPNKTTLSLSWTKDEGYSPYQWNIYAEQMILYILGLGHPTKPLPSKTWRAWTRDFYGMHMPLFIHQYSHVFFDFRSLNDGHQNYFHAGLKATFLHRHLARFGFWGLSAGESPDGYKVNSPLQRSTTICIGCALGSAMFAPDVILQDVADWKNGDHGQRLWGKYGLTDSIDLERNWFSPHVLGITIGPAYMSVNNSEGKTSFWKVFMQIPAIQRAKSLMEKQRNTY